jgi:hypothetical protein
MNKNWVRVRIHLNRNSIISFIDDQLYQQLDDQLYQQQKNEIKFFDSK